MLAARSRGKDSTEVTDRCGEALVRTREKATGGRRTGALGATGQREEKWLGCAAEWVGLSPNGDDPKCARRWIGNEGLRLNRHS